MGEIYFAVLNILAKRQNIRPIGGRGGKKPPIGCAVSSTGFHDLQVLKNIIL